MADWPYNGPWPRIRRAILQRDGYRCHTCGQHADTVNHVIEWRLRPDLAHTPSNLVAECRKCNYGRPQRRRNGIPDPQQW